MTNVVKRKLAPKLTSSMGGGIQSMPCQCPLDSTQTVPYKHHSHIHTNKWFLKVHNHGNSSSMESEVLSGILNHAHTCAHAHKHKSKGNLLNFTFLARCGGTCLESRHSRGADNLSAFEPSLTYRVKLCINLKTTKTFFSSFSYQEKVEEQVAHQGGVLGTQPRLYTCLIDKHSPNDPAQT